MQATYTPNGADQNTRQPNKLPRLVGFLFGAKPPYAAKTATTQDDNVDLDVELFMLGGFATLQPPQIKH